MLLQAFIKKNIFKDAHSSSSQNIIIDIILEINIHVIVHNPLFPDSIFSFAKNQFFFSQPEMLAPASQYQYHRYGSNIFERALSLRASILNDFDYNYIGLLNLPL